MTSAQMVEALTQEFGGGLLARCLVCDQDHEGTCQEF